MSVFGIPFLFIPVLGFLSISRMNRVYLEVISLMLWIWALHLTIDRGDPFGFS